jgi:hypothetical protein
MTKLPVVDLISAERAQEAAELADLLARCQWSHGELARRLDVRLSTVTRWLSAEYRLPDSLLPWLRAMAKAQEELRAKIAPTPPGWSEGARKHQEED